MTRARVFPGGPLTQLRRLRRHRNHLFSNAGLAVILAAELTGVADSAKLTLPFGAVAVDAVTGQAVLLNSGRLPRRSWPAARSPASTHRCSTAAGCSTAAALPPTSRSARRSRPVPGHCSCRTAPSGAGDPGRLDAVLATPARDRAVLESERASAVVPVPYLPGATERALSPLDPGHTAELVEHACTSSRDLPVGVRIDGPSLYGRP